MTTRANYAARRNGRFLEVQDLDGPVSVTNDVEAVILELAKVHPISDLTVIYEDTDGVWDQLLIRNGRFGGFKLLRAGTAEEARRKAA